jgi:L-malate glycosyltransferase
MLEATACGLPVIISDQSGTPERVADGNGLLYKEGDEADLAAKMTLLLDPNLRHEMSEKALLFAQGQDWSKIAQRFIEVGM